MTNTLPAIARISTLDAAITRLSESLRADASENVPKTLKAMLVSGMILPSGINAKDMVPVYGFALKGLPAVALHKVSQKLIRGEFDRGELGFIPRPPDLAALVRGEARREREDLARLRTTRNTIAEIIVHQTPMDEETRQRRRDIVAEAKRRLAIGRGGDVLAPPDTTGALESGGDADASLTI